MRYRVRLIYTYINDLFILYYCIEHFSLVSKTDKGSEWISDNFLIYFYRNNYPTSCILFNFSKRRRNYNFVYALMFSCLPSNTIHRNTVEVTGVITRASENAYSRVRISGYRLFCSSRDSNSESAESVTLTRDRLLDHRGSSRNEIEPRRQSKAMILIVPTVYHSTIVINFILEYRSFPEEYARSSKTK